MKVAHAHLVTKSTLLLGCRYSLAMAEYHILYNWIIVTAQMLIFMSAYIWFAYMLSDNKIDSWSIVCFGTLFSGFLTVLFYLLACKGIIQNNSIKKMFNLRD
ncbi:uncharacterized protein LOC123257206 [Drosophila ananassae]|uniref:uncharacterized protein LOC123257206 n=1 Tax=Drosophila ananassae TaxID=7217 RepID=UPI001CFF55ED|nr:uncharacterized protein LOC123257206 [Drosophila ananassae]